MIAIAKTTTIWRAIADVADLTANEVAFSGDFLYAADLITPLMVWDVTLDAGVGNVRAMTAPEVAARDAQRPVLAARRAKAAATAGIDRLALHHLCAAAREIPPDRNSRQRELATVGGPSPRATRPGLRRRRNITMEWRWAEGRPNRFPALALELVQLKVDIIVAPSTQAALAAKQATSTIPIVVVLSSYPDKVGLVQSLARPGGNVTGLSTSRQN